MGRKKKETRNKRVRTISGTWQTLAGNCVDVREGRASSWPGIWAVDELVSVEAITREHETREACHFAYIGHFVNKTIKVPNSRVAVVATCVIQDDACCLGAA